MGKEGRGTSREVQGSRVSPWGTTGDGEEEGGRAAHCRLPLPVSFTLFQEYKDVSIQLKKEGNSYTGDNMDEL